MQIGLQSAFSPAEPEEQDSGAVERILRAVRDHLGMEVAFASRVSKGRVIIQHADPGNSSLLEVGASYDAEATYCQRIIEGRIPYVIPDAQKQPEVADLAATREMPIGAHISVPLRLSDGSVYGTFCCFSRHADPSLNDRDLHTLQAFAELAAVQIEKELALTELREAALKRIMDVVDGSMLTMHYQPIFRLADRKVVGFEALARFPDHEERSAGEWFADARKVGLGGALEIAAIKEALRVLPRLPSDVYLAVNVAPDTLFNPELWYELADIAAGRVVIEVTEHQIIQDYQELERVLDELRNKVRFAVDDAGAGYSGLRHILDLKPDIIKLDVSLTQGVDRDPARSALAAALVGFGGQIGSRIVAEGVETSAEFATLRDLNVDCGQGFFLKAPISSAALGSFLAPAAMHCSAQSAH